MNKNGIVIFGAGQFGGYLLEIINKTKEYRFLGFVDKIKKSKVICNDKYFEENIETKFKNVSVLIGVQDQNLRNKIINFIERYNINTPNIIDNSVISAKSCKIGKGNVIGTNTVISNKVKIGNYNLIGTSVNILHNTKIYNNVIISGGTNVGANVRIHNNVFAGVGTTIASGKIEIKRNSFVCAGSVVLKTVKSYSKVIGNPAREIL